MNQHISMTTTNFQRSRLALPLKLLHYSITFVTLNVNIIIVCTLPVHWVQDPTRAARMSSVALLAMTWWDTKCLQHWGVCVMSSSFLSQPLRKNDCKLSQTIKLPIKGLRKVSKVKKKQKKRKATLHAIRKKFICATHSLNYILSHIFLSSPYHNTITIHWITCHASSFLSELSLSVCSWVILKLSRKSKGHLSSYLAIDHTGTLCK